MTVWDSLAICETLAERHPEAGLVARRCAARAPWRGPMPPKCIPAFPICATSWAWILRARLPLPELRPETEEQIARIIAAWEEALARYGAEGGFLFGRFSIADCMYAPVVSRFTTYGVKVPAPVQAYMDRIWALPAMQAWLKASQKGSRGRAGVGLALAQRARASG